MAPTMRKKIEQVPVTDEDKEPGVVYIGHVPHGFYEKELLKYFSQFGKVLAIKLSRSKKSGKSKGYAFVKFRYAAVAKTVAETCHNYLFFNKLLKCEYKPLSEVHEDTFFTYKWRPNAKSKRQHNSAKPANKVHESLQRSTEKQRKKLSKLKELGVDLQLEDVMDVPTSVSHAKMRADSEPAVDMEVTSPTQSSSESVNKSLSKGGKKSRKAVPSSPATAGEIDSENIETRPLKRKRSQGGKQTVVKNVPVVDKKKKVAVKRLKK